MAYKALVFDLDGTLYTPLIDFEAEFYTARSRAVNDLLGSAARQIGTVVDSLESSGRHLVLALSERLRVPAREILEQIYTQIDLTSIRPNPRLARIIDGLAMQRTCVILTNSSSDHARRVLNRLGVSSDRLVVVGLEESNFFQKPDAQVYWRLYEKIGVAPKDVLYFDDSRGNVRAAMALGTDCVLVEDPPPSGDVSADLGADPASLMLSGRLARVWATSNICEFLAALDM